MKKLAALFMVLAMLLGCTAALADDVCRRVVLQSVVGTAGKAGAGEQQQTGTVEHQLVTGSKVG